MDQENGYNNWNNPENGGQPHRPVIIVGEQNPDQHKRSNNLSVTSLVLGILSLVFFFVPYVTLIIAVIGLIMGIVSIAQHRDGQGMAVAGIITSGLGLLLALAMLFLLIVASLY